MAFQYLTVKFAAGFTGPSEGWTGTGPLALRMMSSELPEPALAEVEFPEVALPEVEFPAAGFVEVEFPEVELPELGLALPELPEFEFVVLALLVLEFPVFELLVFELLELELLVFELLELPALAAGAGLVELLALALVLPELALGVTVTEPVALALVFPELALGAGPGAGGASGAALPLFPAVGILAAVMGGALAAPYALPEAEFNGFCARACTLPRATKTVTTTAFGGFIFMANNSRSTAFLYGGVYLPGFT
jgi:hypothetical protein